MTTLPIAGICAAVLTPLDAALEPDVAAAVRYYTRLLERGCDALNVLGTTGEAMSFSAAQRMRFMDGLAASGLPLHRSMVGTGNCALADAVALMRCADDAGFAGMLVMPPFFFRDASDDALLRFYVTLVERASLRDAKLYLYNFPRMSGLRFSIDVIGRLIEALPGIVAGVKDSSNDLAYEAEIAHAFPRLAIFPGSEAHLRFVREHRLAGCISGSVNLWPELAAKVWHGADDAELVLMREQLGAYPFIPAVRFLTAQHERDASWERYLPPMEPLREEDRARLSRGLLEVNAGAATATP